MKWIAPSRCVPSMPCMVTLKESASKPILLEICDTSEPLDSVDTLRLGALSSCDIFLDVLRSFADADDKVRPWKSEDLFRNESSCGTISEAFSIMCIPPNLSSRMCSRVAASTFSQESSANDQNPSTLNQYSYSTVSIICHLSSKYKRFQVVVIGMNDVQTTLTIVWR